jgi:hypothetical protein
VLVEFFHQLRKDNSIPRKAQRPFGALAVLVVFILQPGEISLLQAQVTAAIQGVVTDQQGLPIAGGEIVVRADAVGVEIKTTTAADGSFGVVGLQPGAYTVSASHVGFVTKSYADLLLTVNSQLRAMITLVVGSMEQAITVGIMPPLLETGNSSTGSTILPSQVESMPLNGRNYLDLLQLVPGVAINRTVHEGDDNSSPILGERANAVTKICS